MPGRAPFATGKSREVVWKGMCEIPLPYAPRRRSSLCVRGRSGPAIAENHHENRFFRESLPGCAVGLTCTCTRQTRPDRTERGRARTRLGRRLPARRFERDGHWARAMMAVEALAQAFAMAMVARLLVGRVLRRFQLAGMRRGARPAARQSQPANGEEVVWGSVCAPSQVLRAEQTGRCNDGRLPDDAISLIVSLRALNRWPGTRDLAQWPATSPRVSKNPRGLDR
jgi:hypothetical protein